jgi:hemolysin III
MDTVKETVARLKPKWRGRLHELGFYVSIPAGILLVWVAQGTTAKIGAAVFAGTLTLLYGTSAAYHRGKWSPRAERVMKHLDHSMIFVLIAGSYTPFCLLALKPSWGIAILAIAWAVATLGIVLTITMLDRLHKTGLVMYLGLGWLAIIAAPQFAHSLTTAELVLLATGGVLYTVGAVLLATNWPDPNPKVFGYHEIWHSFVIAAGVCHFSAVLLLVRG